MIRLIIALIGLFLVWLWVASGFGRRVKLVVSLLAILASLALVALEVYNHKPRQGLVGATDVQVCGLTVQHSYRSDYKVDVCFKNNGKHSVKRLQFGITATRCDDSGNCVELETTQRDIPLTLEPGYEQQLNQTLRFENVIPDSTGTRWSAEVLTVKAVP